MRAWSRVANRIEPGQHLYHGLVKPREVEHDSQIYRAYRKEAEKIQAQGGEHLRPIEYATGRHVYHLKAKLLYRLIAQPDSQSRREKSDREIKLRLMQLDYVLDHPAQKFLENEAAKVGIFRDKFRLPVTTLPKRGDQMSGNSRYFPDRMPIAITDMSLSGVSPEAG